MSLSDTQPPAAGSPTLAYYTVRAGAMSFGNQKVRSFVEQFINDSDTVLNACAGDSVLHVGNVTRNDLREDVDAAYHSSVSRLDEVVSERYNCIIYDPPFSPAQMSTYGLEEDLWPGYGDDILSVFDSLLRPGGLIIQLGFHATVDAHDTFGYSTEAVGIFNQLGRNDDWSIAVARKPLESEARSSPNTEQKILASDRVVPNQPHIKSEGSFDISYRQYEGSVSEETIASQLLSLVDGKTLLLHWGREPTPFATTLTDRDSPIEGIVPYRGPADRVYSVSLGRGDSKDGISLYPENLLRRLPDIAFDSVILWPHQYASNWTISHNGSSCGYIRAFKRTLDSSLPSDSAVILVGNTATGMRSSWDYEHVGVDVLDGTADLRCTYLSKFGKQQTGLFEEQSTNAPVDIGYRDTGSCGNWIVTRSLDTFYYNPALYVDCPTCGARPNNVCATPGGPEDIHTDRYEAFNSELDRSGRIRYYRHRRYGSVEYQPDESPTECASPSADNQDTAISTKDTRSTTESEQATFLEVL